LPSGTQKKLENRVNWSLYDLFRAGLLQRPLKGKYSISEEGRALLVNPPSRIDRQFLSKYPSFQKFTSTTNKSSNSTKAGKNIIDPSEILTPDEQIGNAYRVLNDTLVSELKDQMAKMDPYIFEQLVIDLLFAMGYGGSREEAAKVTKKSADEGIDGVINEDRLGLDVIYVQAKRWKDQVGRKEIQSFVGALAGKQANKGVFITTSNFSIHANDYAQSVSQKVILINGTRLAELMIEHNVGVSTDRNIQIKRIDSDYFEED
jgi:restriction system protein